MYFISYSMAYMAYVITKADSADSFGEQLPGSYFLKEDAEAAVKLLEEGKTVDEKDLIRCNMCGTKLKSKTDYCGICGMYGGFG